MAPELLRFFWRGFLWSLGGYAGCLGLSLLGLAVDREPLTSFIRLLGYPVAYGSIFGSIIFLGLLLLYGLTALLVRLGSSAASTPAPPPELIGTRLLGQTLTSYKAKHYAALDCPPLQVSLRQYEQISGSKLPTSAYTQSSWWTAVSAHSQQWLWEGWQVVAVDLTGPEPTVTFRPLAATSTAAV
jgi:hypothetical protein